MNTKEVTIEIVCQECGKLETRKVVVALDACDKPITNLSPTHQFCLECLGY